MSRRVVDREKEKKKYEIKFIIVGIAIPFTICTRGMNALYACLAIQDMDNAILVRFTSDHYYV